MEGLRVTPVVRIYGLPVGLYWIWLSDNKKSVKIVNIYVIGSLFYISLGNQLNQIWRTDR